MLESRTEPMTMETIVGAFARVDSAQATVVRSSLSSLVGIDVFDLGDPGKLGLIIEAPSLEAAHARLHDDIESVAGVLKVWPVSAHFDDAGETSPGEEGS